MTACSHGTLNIKKDVTSQFAFFASLRLPRFSSCLDKRGLTSPNALLLTALGAGIVAPDIPSVNYIWQKQVP